MGVAAIDDENLMVVDRRDIIEIKSMLKLLIPKEFTISYIAAQTGKSRQAVQKWLERNAEPEVDYYKKGSKIIVSEQKALQYMSQRRET